MTIQIKQTSDGDIDLSTGRIEWIDGNDAIIQHIKSRLSFAKNTYSIYPDSGVPYFEYILGSKNKGLAYSIIKQTILETPGVNGIVEYDYNFNSSNRTLTISIKIDTIYGIKTINNLTLSIY